MSDTDVGAFSNYTNSLKCSGLLDIPYDKRCAYFQNTSECQVNAYIYRYIQFLYCSLRPASDAQHNLYLFLFLTLCIVLFIILDITAERLFCPSLELLAKDLGFSEHLAGVTILAFGNGSADLFQSLFSMEDFTTTMHTKILGAAIFVTAFVSCVVGLIHPFRLGGGSNHLRDISFFMIGILYIDYAVKSNNYVTTTEAICVILIYILYLVVVFLDHFLLKRHVKLLGTLLVKGAMTVSDFKEFESLRQQSSIAIYGHKARSFNTNATRRSFYGYDASANKNLIRQLVKSLNPIDFHKWSNAGCCQRTMICLKAPIIFVLMLFIPNVNYIKSRHGWSKLLNCTQVVILPFTTFLIMFKFQLWLGVPPCVYTLIASVPLAVLGFRNSRTDKPPKFHLGIALLSAYGSIFVICSSASQTGQILLVFGFAMKLSDSFMSCTLLAWGNSMGDLIANGYLAFYGYHKMAFAACYGAPIISTLLSLGIVWLIKTITSENGYIRAAPGPLDENCHIFLLIILVCTWMWGLTTNFYIRRSLGVFSFSMYGIFFLYIVFAEFDIIQTYAELSDMAYGVN